MKPKQTALMQRAALLVLFYASTGQAQSADTAAANPPPIDPARKYVIEEVVVTARRTEENLQEVPLSVTAMSSDDLARESITTAQDLMGKVPAMVIGPNSTMRNAESPNIRGQGGYLGTNPGVVMYWAEVPLPVDSFTNNQGGPGMLFDIQSIQVLKGPQGTLFGRNTTGGAFVLEPVRPQDTFSARVQGETGNYDDSAYEAVINAPLYNGDTVQLLSRFGAQKVHRDGFTKDVVTGKDYDDRNYWTTRIGLTLRAGDDFEDTFLAYRTRRDENGTGNVFDDINSEGIAGFLGSYLGQPYDPNIPANEQFGCQYFNAQAPSTNCGKDIAAEQQARDIRHVELSADPMDRLSTNAYINNLAWNITDDVKLRYILSATYYQRSYAWDQDGSRAALNDVVTGDAYSSDTKTTTRELQLQGAFKEQGISYVLGAYYERRKPKSLQQNGSVALFVPTTQSYKVGSKAHAIYAQGSIDLGSMFSSAQGWNLTVGARRTQDDVFGFSILETPAFTNRNEEDMKQYAATWLATASYQFDSAMIYGKVARGYRSGGFTGIAAHPDHSRYDPEYVTNYELGIKSDAELSGMPLRLNAAVFYSDYSDMQRTVAESYNGAFGMATFNAGKSEIKGFETDFILLATERLRFSGSYSYMKGKFKEFEIPRSSMTPQSDCTRDDVQNGEIGDYACIPFTDIPRHQYSLSLGYELPFDASVGIVETSLTYSWVDDRYAASISLPETEPGAWLESYGLVNASISWREIFESRFDLQLFGTNLTDEEYRISNSNVWNELAFQNSIWGEPRMYGLRATYRWGA